MTRHLMVAVAVLAFAASPAWAQIRVPGPINSADGKSSKPTGRTPAPPPPSGVPGSRADTDLTSPAQPVVTDMPPTEALFDAINRGDLPAAQEAIGRGADIHGRNVLGLTPLELSVDLGRNSISFLLLSLRSGAGYGDGKAPATTAANAATGRQTAAERRAEAAAERQAKREQQVARTAARAPAAAPRTAALFAGNGGTPAPTAGFLGFDAAR